MIVSYHIRKLVGSCRYVSSMVLERAVVFFAVVAQIKLTVIAVPHCSMAFVFVVATVMTSVLFVGTPYRKVRSAESF